MKDLLINGNGVKTKKLMELENALDELKKENEELKTVLKGMAIIFGQEILAKAKEQLRTEKDDSGIAHGTRERPLTPYEAYIFRQER